MPQVYQYLFNQPTVIQAMLMLFGHNWHYHARKIRDNQPLDERDQEGLRAIKETLTAVSVVVDQVFTYDGEREARIRTLRFADLYWLQHQNGNVIAYFDSQKRAKKYAVAAYHDQIKAFNKLYRQYQKTNHPGLEPPRA